MLTVSDEEFYRRNATGCAREAEFCIASGDEFSAGWFARRAASYALDLLSAISADA